MNRKAFNRINYGLFIVAAAADGKRNGCIVNSLHQVTSSSPYKFSLTVNKSNETFKTIEAAGSFAATVLAKDTPKDLVDLFGYKSGRVVDKFEGFDVQTDEAGNPLCEGPRPGPDQLQDRGKTGSGDLYALYRRGCRGGDLGRRPCPDGG